MHCIVCLCGLGGFDSDAYLCTLDPLYLRQRPDRAFSIHLMVSDLDGLQNRRYVRVLHVVYFLSNLFGLL